ncbi:hypothetical protein MMC12_001893 [Toensbergia leucococca]|nr:hypothetical protein [Toensbergia leucococca]
MLYALGSNGSGQLGIAKSGDWSSPQECAFTNANDDMPGLPVKIAAGGNHTLILFESGDLYSVGKNIDGIFDSDLFLVAQKIKLCSAMWESSVVVTTDNDIYTFGNGSKGELGVGPKVTTLAESQQLDKFVADEAAIVDLASSVNHTVAVLSNGDVYGWGNGRKGQLGKPAQIVWVPRKIEDLGFPVVRAICGREFTYLVGDPTEGHHAIFGSDKWNVISNAPDAVPGWKDIGASWGSIFVLGSSGKITSWGRNDHRQLVSDNGPGVVKMAVGSEHVLVLSTDGKVLAWGWGEHGNCGPNTDENGDVEGAEISLQHKSTPIVGIAAGCATSWLWTET